MLSVAEAAKRADLIMVLAPDQMQGKIYDASIRDGLSAGKTLTFAHGFAIRFGLVKPPADVNVIMVAPKAPGHRFRELFQEGAGVPGLIAVEQDATGNAKEIALAYAKGLGLTAGGRDRNDLHRRMRNGPVR